MNSLRNAILSLAAAVLGLAAAQAAPPPDRLDAQVEALSQQLRCLVCRNQSLADSQAPLALDLKAELREQLAAGRSEAQVVEFLVARYGDYVLYRPPFRPATWLLWLAPLLLALAGLAVLARQSRRDTPAEDIEEEEP